MAYVSRFHFKECDVELFGIVCSTNCNCVAENTQAQTQDCDPVSGFCVCKPEWTGTKCEEDVNECGTEAHNCGAKICRNTVGGFECHCKDGLVPGTDGSCVEGMNFLITVPYIL